MYFSSLTENLIVIKDVFPVEMSLYFTEKFYRRIKAGSSIEVAYKFAKKQLVKALKSQRKFFKPGTKVPYEFKDEILPELISDKDTSKDTSENDNGTLTPKEKDEVYQALKKFNFSEQLIQFTSSVKENIPICLIHGKLSHGQKWLYNRLLTKYGEILPSFTFSKPKNIEPSSSIKEFDHLLRQFALYLSLRPKGNSIESFCDELVGEVSKVLQTESFIVRILNPSKFEEIVFIDFLEKVWIPTVKAIRSIHNFKEKPHRMLLFLVELEFEVPQNHWIIDSIPSELINVLPVIKPIGYNEFKVWAKENNEVDWVYENHYKCLSEGHFNDFVRKGIAEFLRDSSSQDIYATPDFLLDQLFPGYIDMCTQI